MNRSAAKSVQRRFLIAFGHAVYVTWPVLSTILAVQVALGLLIGFVEGWSFGDALYFTFVTGLTIGYGDIVPRQALTRALAGGRSPVQAFFAVCGPAASAKSENGRSRARELSPRLNAARAC